VAGFPSGEAYKVGADYPYARLHRAFIRQTIDLGGDTSRCMPVARPSSGADTKRLTWKRAATTSNVAITIAMPTNARAFRWAASA
jgi:hypothetical protein